MACSGQIESHVALVQEARNKMKLAEDTSLPRIDRLDLLSEASDLIHCAMQLVGRLPNLRELLVECSTQFLGVQGSQAN